MKKSIFLWIISTFVILHASELIYPGGKVEKYTLLKQQRDLGTEGRTYIYHHQKYEDIGKIYVSFGKKVDLESFMQKYRLQFIKVTNPAFYTVLFKVEKGVDIIALCSDINLHEEVRYAKPNWKRVRKLH
jgi:hypothetical protein